MFIAKNRLTSVVGFMVAKSQHDTPTFTEFASGTYDGVEVGRGKFDSSGCTYTAKIKPNRKKKIPANTTECTISASGIDFMGTWEEIPRGTQVFFTVEENKLKIYAVV